MGIVPILLCFELNTLLGSGMIVASGVAYGFMALGKKLVPLHSQLCSTAYYIGFQSRQKRYDGDRNVRPCLEPTSQPAYSSRLQPAIVSHRRQQSDELVTTMTVHTIY